MQVNIRKASAQDFPIVLSLIKEFSDFQKNADKVFMTVDQMLEDQLIFQCFIAEMENKEVVGFATYFFTYYSWTGKALYLDDLYVREAYRKEGIGKKLLDIVIDQARTEKCKKIRWQVSKWNTNAIEFYKGIGATIDEVEINCDLIV